MSSTEDPPEGLMEVVDFLSEYKPRRDAAVAAGLCGSCCDVGRWNVRATVVSVPPLDHVKKYNAQKELTCAHCAEQHESYGWGYTTLRVL